MNISCAILAGGRSTRMGKDKTTITMGGRTLVEMVAHVAKRVFDDVCIVARNPDIAVKLGVRHVSDILPVWGSMTGIASALLDAGTSHVFVLAADMPNVDENALRYMIGQIKGEDMIIPRLKKGFEPLHAIYGRTCLSPMLTSIERGMLKISGIFPYLCVGIIEDAECFYRNNCSVFMNINTESDLAMVPGCQPDPYVRNMRMEDIEEVLDIEKHSFIAPWTRRSFEETIQSPISRCYVLQAGASIAGYVLLYAVQDEAHILNVAVRPDFRGRGNGSGMLMEVMEQQKNSGVRSFFLEVREGNARAVGLYTRLGFSVIGRRKKYYSESNEDALVMYVTAEACTKES